MTESIVLSPPPVFFIKSISEQGYSLSTAIADLVDNSLTAGAKRIELLINTNVSPLRFFIADDGCGMSGEEITANMRIPSADLDGHRASNDLGRFGMGLKTGSFSQARRFTLLSAKKGMSYHARTWDVEYLKKTEDWTLMIETDQSTQRYLEEFDALSSEFHGRSNTFVPNTVVIWDKLYKLERLKKQSEINDELEELRSHLGLVFHRFLKSAKIEIRLNNSLVEGFDPFPLNSPGVQIISDDYWQSDSAYVRFQGIILPKKASAEALESPSAWTPPGKTLEDCQGIYVYRNERLISYGGWLRTITKTLSLQFGRLMIDISNINDSEFHLNVAKSSLKLPFGLKRAMMAMIRTVASQALKEYRERAASKVVQLSNGQTGLSLIVREATSVGIKLKINDQFELLHHLSGQLTTEQNNILGNIILLLEKKLNEVWIGDNTETEITKITDPIMLQKIRSIKDHFQEADYSEEEIRNFLLNNFGADQELRKFINDLNF